MKVNLFRGQIAYIVDFNENDDLTIKRGEVQGFVVEMDDVKESPFIERTKVEILVENKKGRKLINAERVFDSEKEARAAMHYTLATQYKYDLKKEPWRANVGCWDFRAHILGRR